MLQSGIPKSGARQKNKIKKSFQLFVSLVHEIEKNYTARAHEKKSLEETTFLEITLEKKDG
jgi:hypothetical protein